MTDNLDGMLLTRDLYEKWKIRPFVNDDNRILDENCVEKKWKIVQQTPLYACKIEMHNVPMNVVEIVEVHSNLLVKGHYIKKS